MAYYRIMWKVETLHWVKEGKRGIKDSQVKKSQESRDLR
jgi:hypothetical protein